MITTPPGLYYLSLAYVASLFPVVWLAMAAQSLSELCSTSFLRSVNGILAIMCGIIVYDLLIHLKPTLGERKAIIYSILISMYPVHWFFAFLYYTDVASLTAILAMYLASLKRQYWIGAMLGALATLVRQTNVVWILFVAANEAIDYADDLYRKKFIQWGESKIMHDENYVLTEEKHISVALTLRRRRVGSSNDTNLSVSETTEVSSCHASGVIDEILDAAIKLWSLKWKVLFSFAPFLMVLVAFVIFVIYNGGIVLGAKEAHVISLHFAQMLYFGLASAAAMAPVHFTLGQASSLWLSFRNNKICHFFLAPMVLIIGIIAVHFFSIAHPYLLADNRHYPFYIWRKVVQAHWTMKYLLVPLYVYSWFSIMNILGKDQKKIWLLSFFVASALVLIPSPLIEFRYYTIPLIFLILHSPISNDKQWMAMGIIYVFVDVLTMAIFLFRPFQWDNVHETQRFIW